MKLCKYDNISTTFPMNKRNEIHNDYLNPEIKNVFIELMCGKVKNGHSK